MAGTSIGMAGASLVMTTSINAVPADLIVDFDVYDPTLAEPEDVFQERVLQLAAVGPVVYSPYYGGHWIITQYQEIAEVLRDPARFSSYPNNLVPHGFGKFLSAALELHHVGVFR